MTSHSAVEKALLWATFLCTSKERWLAPRRGAKALDPASAVAWVLKLWKLERSNNQSGNLKAKLSLLPRRSELLLFARAKRSNQERRFSKSRMAGQARPCLHALSACSTPGPLRRRDFSTRHPCPVEKRRARPLHARVRDSRRTAAARPAERSNASPISAEPMHVTLRVFPAGSVIAEGDPEVKSQRQRQNHRQQHPSFACTAP